MYARALTVKSTMGNRGAGPKGSGASLRNGEYFQSTKWGQDGRLPVCCPYTGPWKGGRAQIYGAPFLGYPGQTLAHE